MIANLRNKVLDNAIQALNSEFSNGFGVADFLEGRIKSMEAAYRMQFDGMGTRLDPRLGRAASDFIERTIAAEDFIGISAISLNVLQEVQLPLPHSFTEYRFSAVMAGYPQPAPLSPGQRTPRIGSWTHHL